MFAWHCSVCGCNVGPLGISGSGVPSSLCPSQAVHRLDQDPGERLGCQRHSPSWQVRTFRALTKDLAPDDEPRVHRQPYTGEVLRWPCSCAAATPRLSCASTRASIVQVLSKAVAAGHHRGRASGQAGAPGDHDPHQPLLRGLPPVPQVLPLPMCMPCSACTPAYV